MKTPDIEAYVQTRDCDAIIAALATKLGPLDLNCLISEGQYLYLVGDTKLILNSYLEEDGYTSVWIRGSSPWDDDVALGRFLSNTLQCITFCDPGQDYPEVPPYCDTFLEINRNNERLVSKK